VRRISLQIDDKTYEWLRKRSVDETVDTASFVVMKQRGIDTAFAFASDFVAAGFNVLTAPRRP
jgi:predicted nucleic acid-binding protein